MCFHSWSSEVFFRLHEDWDGKELPGLSGVLCRQPVSGWRYMRSPKIKWSSVSPSPLVVEGGKPEATFPATFASNLLQSVISFFSPQIKQNETGKVVFTNTARRIGSSSGDISRQSELKLDINCQMGPDSLSSITYLHHR